MEKKLEVGIPLTFDGVTVIPVVEISTGYRAGGKSVYCFGTTQPEYVLVVSGPDKRAFKTTGEEVPLDWLVNEIPELGG